MADEMMQEQMEFSGLVPDPNEIDPVSGNEIPLGSTAEGVRDDETAAISPGEFVIPEYAVNFHGIKFYVETLQIAQQGLKQIEQMGLVGNPDEEQIPDATPLPEVPTEEAPQEQFQRGGVIMDEVGKPMQPTLVPSVESAAQMEGLEHLSASERMLAQRIIQEDKKDNSKEGNIYG